MFGINRFWKIWYHFRWLNFFHRIFITFLSLFHSKKRAQFVLISFSILFHMSWVDLSFPLWFVTLHKMWEREFQFLLHVSSLKGPCVSQTISRWLPFDETNASQVYSSNGKSLLYTINSKKTNKWKHHRKCFINIVVWFCLWSTYNLGQNNWNSKPPFPPTCKSKMKPCKSQNVPFSHPRFFWGEGEGGINFPFWFILSKILVLDVNISFHWDKSLVFKPGGNDFPVN